MCERKPGSDYDYHTKTIGNNATLRIYIELCYPLASSFTSLDNDSSTISLLRDEFNWHQLLLNSCMSQCVILYAIHFRQEDVISTVIFVSSEFKLCIICCVSNPTKA